MCKAPELFNFKYYHTLYIYIYIYREREREKEMANSLQSSCLENPMDRGT